MLKQFCPCLVFFELKKSFLFSSLFYLFLQLVFRYAPAVYLSCELPKVHTPLPLPWLLPHLITSFLGNGVLTSLLYNAKPQWDKKILSLSFFYRVCLFPELVL